MSSYRLLEQHSDEALPDKAHAIRCSHSSTNHVHLALIACLILTCINCLLLYASSSLPNQCVDPIMQVTTENMHELRRPSPFIGLQDIQRPVPPVERELVNFPQVLQQVNRAKPEMVYDDDPLAYMSVEGLVSPEIRRVLVTDDVSTLIQFRVIDFGMEMCEIHLRFPLNTTVPPTSKPFMISLNRLDERVPLSTRTLSYNTRPKQTSSILQLNINPWEDDEVHWWQKFACSWDELLVFELECSGEERLGNDDGSCRLEWWQDKKEDGLSPSVYVKQYSTV